MELWDVYDINKRFTGKVIDRHSDERLKEFSSRGYYNKL